MSLLSRYQAARAAYRQRAEAERLERTRKLLSASDLSPAMVEAFIRGCPPDTVVQIFPAGGGQIQIYRTRKDGQAVELARGPEW